MKVYDSFQVTSLKYFLCQENGIEIISSDIVTHYGNNFHVPGLISE